MELLSYKKDVNKDMNLGYLLRKARKERHLTIEAVASELGLSKSLLSNYERNINNIPSDKLLALLDFYCIEPLNFLVNGKEYIDITHFSDINKQKVLAINDEENKNKALKRPYFIDKK